MRCCFERANYRARTLNQRECHMLAVCSYPLVQSLQWIVGSVPARLGERQGAKEIGHNLAREKPQFGHNLVRKRHKIGHSLERERPKFGHNPAHERNEVWAQFCGHNFVGD